jgi:hypothetical protein
MKSLSTAIFFLLALHGYHNVFAQTKENLWHGIEREIHYRPDGEDFVLVNGTRRFNRALYGGNTGFRAEAGDLPEFALYLPGMGGNLKFGLITADKSKWITEARKIETRYRPGSMIYTIRDPLLGGGSLIVTALATFDMEGLIIRTQGTNIPVGIQLVAVYGGATGTRFSREGDIGADPESSFYLKPEYCKGNIYRIDKNNFTLYFGSRTLSEEERYEIQYKAATDSSKLPATMKTISGVFPVSAQLKIADANNQASPLQVFSSKDSSAPMITAQMNLTTEAQFFFVQNGAIENSIAYTDLQQLFDKTEEQRKILSGRVKINTPDPYINTLGGALVMASDAVWEAPSFMHGAVAWRMRLNGWRGAYLADVLGWHDRARMHFDSYALSQVISPASGPVVMDTALHLARHAERMGTSLFSSGYISRNPGGDQRPHHYDMNLVFIDQLLNHFLWTGDTAYVKKMFPLVKLHLNWETRNFDTDGDNLYDAYASIWASDALQYSGGGVTHSSSYNYKAFAIAAELAEIVGEDPEPYRRKSLAIKNAINSKLWMPSLGVYAEYKDLLGKKLLHPSPALWTIYHAIDSKVPDRFQAYQSLRYVDNNIPRIPIRARGLEDTSLYTISTSNWQPYTWSLNNVVLGELMHTALAYWQGGRSEEAYQLWKSSLVESMYLGASPGNFQQLSFYDAIRGELYRDFADDIGMTARSLVEGLFGISPDVLHGYLYVTPGFPAVWDHASISTPDVDFSFESTGATDAYRLTSRFPRDLKMIFMLNAKTDSIASITVNGEPADYSDFYLSVGKPMVRVEVRDASNCTIEINWAGKSFETPVARQQYARGETIRLQTKEAAIINFYDPQKSLLNAKLSSTGLNAIAREEKGDKCFFLRLRQGMFHYWLPVNFNAVKPVSFEEEKMNGSTTVRVINHTPAKKDGKVFINHQLIGSFSIERNSSLKVSIPANVLVSGTNQIDYKWNGGSDSENYIEWDINNPSTTKYEQIDLSRFFNDEVNRIFKNQYLSPRPKGPTLQLPTQGIGNWAYPLVMPEINDSGLRARAGIQNEFKIAQGIPFSTPSRADVKNILFTSQWDNYPDSATIPLRGKSSHAYFLLAGSTNPMQSRMINGAIVVSYKDGSSQTLDLKNPDNWWPIEQDYYTDGFAFTTNAPKPVRVYLKTGEDTRNFKDFITLRGFSNRGIDGGAATVLDLPLDPSKELKSFQIKTISNDVVIGIMAISLCR